MRDGIQRAAMRLTTVAAGQPPAQPPAGLPPAGGTTPQALAVTGMDVWQPLTLGFALVLGGGALVAAGRSSRARRSVLDELFALSEPRA